MQTIRITLFILIIIGLGLLATQMFWVPSLVNWIVQSENKGDPHGCPIVGGYAYDEHIGACVRAKDLTPDISDAAASAVKQVGAEYGLTVSSFNSYEDGSYDITLARGENGTETTVHISSGGGSETTQNGGAQTTGSSVATAGSNAVVTGSYGKAKVYTDAELLAVADNKYADGTVPLGDGKYTTNAPKKGYVYLCHTMNGGGGAQANGPWINGTTWNYLNKLSVDGSISWAQATFTNVISGAYRMLSGNDLPISHTTGVFPVKASDDVYQYDRNPNTISAQSLNYKLPADPVYSETPYCMGGEVGVMLSGVALFNGFDAENRDAPAHEAQDTCDGHPQEAGEYHYHSLSACFKDIGVKTVLGYALDGFPITGPKVASDKFLTTEDLDECHGIVSNITIDGKAVTTYHYVMTYDFPYSASCFRGKPATTAPSASNGSQQNAGTQSGGAQQGGGQPPQGAVDACSGKSTNVSCSFSTPNGTISGTCKTPPNTASLACVPQ